MNRLRIACTASGHRGRDFRADLSPPVSRLRQFSGSRRKIRQARAYPPSGRDFDWARRWQRSRRALVSVGCGFVGEAFIHALRSVSGDGDTSPLDGANDINPADVASAVHLEDRNSAILDQSLKRRPSDSRPEACLRNRRKFSVCSLLFGHARALPVRNRCFNACDG